MMRVQKWMECLKVQYYIQRIKCLSKHNFSEADTHRETSIFVHKTITGTKVLQLQEISNI